MPFLTLPYTLTFSSAINAAIANFGDDITLTISGWIVSVEYTDDDGVIQTHPNFCRIDDDETTAAIAAARRLPL